MLNVGQLSQAEINFRYKNFGFCPRSRHDFFNISRDYLARPISSIDQPLHLNIVRSLRRMLERTRLRFNLHPERLAADPAYGTAVMLGWLVEEQCIEPHIPDFDKSGSKVGGFSVADFTYSPEEDAYCEPVAILDLK